MSYNPETDKIPSSNSEYIERTIDRQPCILHTTDPTPQCTPHTHDLAPYSQASTAFKNAAEAALEKDYLVMVMIVICGYVFCVLWLQCMLIVLLTNWPNDEMW